MDLKNILIIKTQKFQKVNIKTNNKIMQNINIDREFLGVDKT